MARMKESRPGRGIRVVFSAVVAASMSMSDPAAGAEAEKAAAREILDATGVHGGLIVHLGCGGGELTGALAANDACLVQGLDADPENVAKARDVLRALGVYGKVTVDHLRGTRLPYVDNLVRLVVSEDPGRVSMKEVGRVLCPGGVAYVKDGGSWKKTVKPVPGEIDEWTHFLHGPDNNAVANDTVVGPPCRLQWIGQPKFARAHEQAASLSACVTSRGRLFYIVDEAPRADIRFPSQWFLVARDAFNGVVLWRRAISDWVDQFRRFRAGPAGTAFRLVAKDDRVYVTLGIKAPVSILDAATGRTLATCEGTEHARQILLADEKLIVLLDDRPEVAEGKDAAIRRGNEPAPGKRAIVAADPATGTAIWRKQIEKFVHPSLAAREGRLFYQTNDGVHCLDLGTGEQAWTAPARMELKGHEAGWESPTLVAGGGMVYSADFRTIRAHSASDGKLLWEGSARAGYNFPPDVFLIDDLVWTKAGGITGADPATGEVRKKLPEVRGYMHARCYRNKATERFIILGNLGVQFVDLESAEARINHWIRGTCQYGIMPANGLLYVTPDSCACNMKTKLAGLWALSSESVKLEIPGDDRLDKGPAFGKIDRGKPPGEDAWPVYRHDFARSGVTSASVPVDLKAAWEAEPGGRLSGITVADGRVFVSAIDEDTIHALDERSGKTLWTFTAGGRVDTPPTLHAGMALFGSADGHVYALRATDGELAWRFRAAPDDRRTFANGRVESVWPVHGSLVIHDGKLAVAAGRSSYLDGGVRLYQLDPATGRLLSETVMFSPDPETGKQPAGGGKDVRGVKTDILVADGDAAYMRHVKLDFETGDDGGTGTHLFCPAGLLDDTWWHRSYWVLHDQFTSHWSGWWIVGNQAPSGRILSYDDRSVYGYGRDKYPSGNTGQWRGGEKYRIFASDRRRPGAAKPAEKRPLKNRAKQSKRSNPKSPPTRWEKEIPFYVRAMAVAGDTMFIAGPAQAEETKQARLALSDGEGALAAWNGERGSHLWAVSTMDGRKLGSWDLESPPVWDGMAAVQGRLLLSTRDGRVICFGGR